MLDKFYLRDMNKFIQRKSTAKWIYGLGLSFIEIARILELLAKKELTQCVLAIDLEKNLQRYYFILKTTDKWIYLKKFC